MGRGAINAAQIVCSCNISWGDAAMSKLGYRFGTRGSGLEAAVVKPRDLRTKK